MRPVTVAGLCAPVALGLFTLAATPIARVSAAEVALAETGSTLAYPVFRIWAAEYPKTHPGVTVSAAATDSGAGVEQARLRFGDVGPGQLAGAALGLDLLEVAGQGLDLVLEDLDRLAVAAHVLIGLDHCLEELGLGDRAVRDPPVDLQAHLPDQRVLLGRDPASQRALAGGGYQSVDGSVAASYDVQVSLIGRLPGNGRAEFHFDRNSFASNSGGGSGYWINTVSVSVTYPIGI